MFRKRKEAKSSEPEGQTAQPQSSQAPASSGGWHRSELTTFDGKGNPSVIVYSTDGVGRTVKTRMGRRRGH